VAFSAASALSLLPALRIQRELVAAKTALVAGKDAFFAGDLPTARHRFDEAASAFIQARARVDTPFLNLASMVPIAGRTPDTIVAMATAGASVAGAGSTLAQAVARLPGGLGALAPVDGQISLKSLRALRPVLATVAGQVNAASRALSFTQSRWVIPPVADARRQFEAPLRVLDSALRSATAVARQLPEFLGEKGRRRYFVAAQNPAEVRGTGGFIGSWAVLFADHGRVKFTKFRPIEVLPDAVGTIKPPNPDFGRRYGGFGGAGFWRNINITPDLPSASVAIERLFKHVTGVTLDGVIAADPFALAALLSATGPVNVPSLHTKLNAGNVVSFTTNTAYSTIEDPQARKEVLGDAAKATFDRFVGGTGNPIDAVRALTASVANGHIAFHSTRPAVQESFETAHAAGQLLSPAGDFVAVSVTNSAANKLDFYVRKAVRYDVRLNADGSARAVLEVRIDNPSPTSGQPQYVIGPFPGASGRGESVSYLSAYCGSGCELERHTVDGHVEPVGVDRELGHRVFAEFVRVPAGSERTLGYELTVPRAWLGDDLAGAYRVTVQEQPGLIHPTTLTVVVHAPPGTSISQTSVPMRVEGATATWTGPAEKLQMLRVEFHKPLLVRAWSRFVRFLVKPLV
jgi:hypothetical protein